MGLLPSNYNECKQFAGFGHGLWACILGAEFALGHFRPTLPVVGQVGTSLAVNVAMLPCALLHGAISRYVYGGGIAEGREKEQGVATFNRKYALGLNVFLFAFTISMDVLYKYGLWDAKKFGLGDFDHGVYCVSTLQMWVNLLTNVPLFLGEIPLMMYHMGWADFFGWGNSKNKRA